MRAGAGCLEPSDRDIPVALPGEVLIKVRACGVCRTDLHLVDGELSPPELPIVPGHEIVGVVEAVGDGVTQPSAGDRVGIPWLGYACGQCDFCRRGRENLCVNARFTGYHNDGGYAEYAVADANYAFKIPDGFSDVEAAPLMCAGLIGFRAYRMAGEGRRLGLYGFGAAAHLIAQVAVHDKREVFAFTKAGDEAAQALARELDDLHRTFGKPVIMTEFGADAIPGTHAMPPEMWTEEYQVELLRCYLDVTAQRPFMAGLHVWAFADFKTGQSIGRSAGMNFKGVFTRDRRPKMAAHFLRSRWAES